MMQFQSLKVFKLASSIAFLSLFSLSPKVNAQKADPFQGSHKVPISAEVYGNLKAQGKLNPNATYEISQPVKSGVLSHKKSVNPSKKSRELTSPSCGFISTVDFQDPWGGEVHFDDAPPAGEFSVPIPFDFCFYGTTYNSFIINNNGNITFDASYTTFTSYAFPDATIPAMIAPFWGDVDTGSPANPLGQVRYDVYPEYAVVSWDSVAVYNEQANLRNTFQLIISNGTSNVLPAGSNIAFIYGDMQWTTGDASQGINGFGGTPATVGVNRGDGVDYIQLGRFDAEGTAYDGPFGANDQVSFLDNTIFYFNTCLQPGTLNNIAPIAIGAPICDTITVCVGSDYALEFSFIPVEPGQTVGAELITTAIPGLTVLPSVPGAQCDVLGTFSGSLSNLGYQTVTFTATDDGTPTASYTIDIIFNVIESGLLSPEISGVPSICDGASTNLSVIGGGYETYLWSPFNQTTPSITIADSGSYSVTVTIGSCFGTSSPFNVTIEDSPTPVILGADTICNSSTTQLYTNEPFISYLWSNSSVLDTINVSSGTYIVTVTDETGCSGTSPSFTISSIGNLGVDFNLIDTFFCDFETQVVLSEGFPIGGVYSGPGVSANGNFNPSIAGAGFHIISYTYTINGCSETKSDSVIVEICSGLNEQLTSDAVRIFPNPAFDKTTLTVQGIQTNSDVSIHVIDGSGREIQKHIISSTNKEKSFEFSVEDLAKGIYSVIVKSEKYSSVHRFIKM